MYLDEVIELFSNDIGLEVSVATMHRYLEFLNYSLLKDPGEQYQNAMNHDTTANVQGVL
jgi:hypothetical protein